MVRLRGRAIHSAILVVTVWTGVRIAFQPGEPAIVLTQQPPQREHAESNAVRPAAVINTGLIEHINSAGQIEVPRKAVPLQGQFISISSGLPPARIMRRIGDRPPGLSAPAAVAAGYKPLSAGNDTLPIIALAAAEEAGLPIKAQREKRLTFYGYSYWRGRSSSLATYAPGAQYGGSQSGFVSTWNPLGSGNRGVALLLRGYATPDGNEHELAFGFRWQPSHTIPLNLSVERRVVGGGSDRFATYASGGVSGVGLPADFGLDAFGQAGVVFGRDRSMFFDGHVRIKRQITTIGGARLNLGAGAWAGGQKGATRLDVGPSIDVSLSHFDLRLDWRQRVAGSALPSSGFALTASTYF